MSRYKTKRKAEFHAFGNCFVEDQSQKGKWADYFANNHPIAIELGCGKADLSMGLARLQPEINYVGVDVKSPRMWVAARVAVAEEIKNIAFLRCHISRIAEHFAEQEVNELWITFPDPFPRSRQMKHRLTEENYLKQYLKILKPGGTIHFKTDNDELFEWTVEHYEKLNRDGSLIVEVLSITRDLHHSELLDERNGIITDFERKFLAEEKTTKYMKYTIRNS